MVGVIDGLAVGDGEAVLVSLEGVAVGAIVGFAVVDGVDDGEAVLGGWESAVPVGAPVVGVSVVVVVGYEVGASIGLAVVGDRDGTTVVGVLVGVSVGFEVLGATDGLAGVVIDGLEDVVALDGFEVVGAAVGFLVGICVGL